MKFQGVFFSNGGKVRDRVIGECDLHDEIKSGQVR